MPKFSIRSLAALFLFSSLLVSCATRSNLAPDVAPPRPAPATCVQPAAEPRLPDDAGIVAPTTDASRAATQVFLNWVSDLAQWGRELAKAQKKAADAPSCH